MIDKSRFRIRRKKYWYSGGALAVLGVLIVRLAAPEMNEYSGLAHLIGITLAIGGLLIIAIGTRISRDEMIAAAKEQFDSEQNENKQSE